MVVEAPFAVVSEPEDGGPRPGATELIIDRDAILKHMGGDPVLLQEAAEVFFESYPGELARVREAVAQRDARALQRSAHGLKGMVSNFTLKGAYEAAQKLEDLGLKSRFPEAPALCALLEEEMARLRQDMEVLLQEVAR